MKKPMKKQKKQLRQFRPHVERLEPRAAPTSMMGLGLGAALLADVSLAESIFGDLSSSDKAGLFSDEFGFSKLSSESATPHAGIPLPSWLGASVRTAAQPGSARSNSSVRGLDPQEPMLPQVRGLSSPLASQRSSAILGAGIGPLASSARSTDPAAIDRLLAMSSGGSTAGGTSASLGSLPSFSAGAGTFSAGAGIQTGGPAPARTPSQNQPTAAPAGAAGGAKADAGAAASAPSENVTSSTTAEAGTAAAPQDASTSDASAFTGRFVVELKGRVSSERLASRYGLVHESAVADANGNVNIWKIPEDVNPESRVGRWLDRFGEDPQRIAPLLERNARILNVDPVYQEPTPSGGTLRMAGSETDIITPYQRTEPSAATTFDGAFVVQLRPKVSSETQAAKLGFVHDFSYPNLGENLNVWRIPEDVDPATRLGKWMGRYADNPERIARNLEHRAQILEAYPVYKSSVSSRGFFDDPLLPAQWHLYNVGQAGGTAGLDGNVQAAWDLGVTGQGATIGIVDDGLQYTHPDLGASGLAYNNDGGNYVALASYDFNFTDDNPAPTTSDKHGTSVAGVAAAIGNNGRGGAGVAPNANLGGIRLIAAATTDTQEAQALGWNTTVASQFDASLVDIYSNSWGPTDNGKVQASGALVQAAFSDSAANGRGGLGNIYTWAGGNGRTSNDNVNYDGYANNRHVIAVAAVDQNGDVATYSEPGAPLLISAPSSAGSGGEGITTTDLVGTDGYHGTDYTDNFGGTSSATPYVSGVIALMLQANPTLTWRDVQHILVRSAIRNDTTDSGWAINGGKHPVNHDYGFGLINASGAVNLASNWQSVGPELLVDSGTQTVSATIPDNDTTGLTRSVTISPDISVEHVEVVFDATHTYRGDLEVVLTAPSGTTSTLAAQRIQDSGDDYSSWVFSSTRHWDETSAGDWTLKVSDLDAGVTGTWNSWQLRIYGTEIASDTAGPRVTGITDVNGVVNGGSVSSFQVQFDESINTSTFTPADVGFQRVGGSPITIAGVSAVSGTGDRVFNVTFAGQSTTGSYKVDIGPNITDTTGNFMDQDGDGTNGETTEDKYTEFFTLADQFIYSDVSTTGTAIPDSGFGTLTRSITLPAVDVADLNVLLNITHDFASFDLRISLSAPGVTSRVIAADDFDTTGSSTNGYLDTVIDDEATNLALDNSAHDGVLHSTDSYQSANVLSAFDGSRSAGAWTLTVADVASGTTGTYSYFNLILTPSSVFDVSLDSVTNTDSDRDKVEVTYTVTGGTASSFDLGVYESTDPFFNINSDTNTGTYSVTTGLTVGTHTVEVPASSFPDPSFTRNEDLYSLVVVDPLHAISDQDRYNNQGILSGVTLTDTGTLYIAGNAFTANTVTLSPSTVTFNGTGISYDSVATNDVVFTGSTEADTFTATGVSEDILAFMGPGNDTYTGGNQVDVVQGGPGDDILTGNNGNDRLFGMQGSDTVSGGAGDDLLSVGPGTSQTMSGAGGGNDRFVIGGTVFNDHVTVWDPNDSDGLPNPDPNTISSTLQATVKNPVNPSGYSAVTIQSVTISGVGSSDLLYVGTGPGDDYIQLQSETPNFGLGVGNSIVGINALVGAGAGNDTIYGGRGSDVLYGDQYKTATTGAGDGDDYIDSRDGSANDTLYGAGGANTLLRDPGDT